jgi:hypothetical protein
LPQVQIDYFYIKDKNLKPLKEMIYKNKESNIRQELNIFGLYEKINECQQNYSEHNLRMTTNQILQKLFDYLPEGRKKRS